MISVILNVYKRPYSLEKNKLYGILTDELVKYLGEDLFTAPASTMKSLHNAFPGGLVEHILKTTK